MHAIVTIVRSCNVRVYKASVDVRPIQAMLARRHASGDEVSGFFHSITHAVSSIGKTSLLKSISKAIKSVPVVGPLAVASTSIMTMPLSVATQLASGGRIDKVAFSALKDSIANVQTVAPYAQAVISFVPGVGQGLSGAIGASVALASGHSISDAMVAAVKGAMPGGPLAVAAFSVAQSVARGDGLDKAALNALPLSPAAKDALVRGLALTKDLASGKRVDLSLIDQATRALPPEVTKAVQIGTAIGHAVSVQAKTRKPGSSPVLSPPVSTSAVAAYAIAKNAVEVLDQAHAVKARVTSIANSGSAAARAAAHGQIQKIQTLMAERAQVQSAMARLANQAHAGDKEALAAQRVFAIVLKQHQALKARTSTPAARGLPGVMITSTGRLVPGHYLEQRASKKLGQSVVFDGKKILRGKYAAA